jgi:hypothetical protein
LLERGERRDVLQVVVTDERTALEELQLTIFEAELNIPGRGFPDGSRKASSCATSLGESWLWMASRSGLNCGLASWMRTDKWRTRDLTQVGADEIALLQLVRQENAALGAELGRAQVALEEAG